MNESIMKFELKLPLLSGIDVKLTDDSTETQHSACNFFFSPEAGSQQSKVPASITCPAGGIEAFSQLSAVEAKYRNVREKNPYAVDDCRFISHTSQAGCRHGLPHMYMCSAVTLSLHSACHSVNELSNHNQRIFVQQTNKQSHRHQQTT